MLYIKITGIHQLHFILHVVEEVKLAAVEDKPDGDTLSRTEVASAAAPEPVPPPTKEPEEAPEKVVVVQEKEKEMTPIIAPQPVTCHQTNEVCLIAAKFYTYFQQFFYLYLEIDLYLQKILNIDLLPPTKF